MSPLAQIDSGVADGNCVVWIVVGSGTPHYHPDDHNSKQAYSLDAVDATLAVGNDVAVAAADDGG